MNFDELRLRRGADGDEYAELQKLIPSVRPLT